VRDVVDSNGDLRIHRNFDAFGNIVDETHYDANGAVVTGGQAGYVDEAFAFTGRYFDKSTGLQNNLNRWYDPDVGRWLSEDPIGFAAGDANLYRYVGNEPTMGTDATGLSGPSKPAWSDPNGFLNELERRGGKLRAGFAPKNISGQSADGFGRLFVASADIAVALVFDTAGDVYELVTGQTPISGEPTSRAGAAVCLVIPYDDLLKILKKLKRGQPKGGAYVLRDPDTGDVVRSGRTNDLNRRRGELGRDPKTGDYDFDPIYPTDDYMEQRGLEQELDWRYDPPLNKIRGIDPRNPRLRDYLQAANDYLDRLGF
jgi:RHS repeat-associated protein